jgi:hypothetical protein
MHCPPAEDNFCDDYENVVKPAIVQDCNRHMGYVDKRDNMTNSYSIIRHMEMDKKIVLSPSGPFNSEQFYSPHFLWLKTVS